jgi:glycosyltransferase involved in cell wall biosynthesis
MGKINNVAKFYFLAKNPKVSNVFLLNDETERYFNNLYKTNKFKYLPDPFMKIEHIPMDLRTKLSIPSDAEIFLHFGGLSERKGTIELLEAISLLTKEEAANKFFIFAGKISSSIKSRFYDIYDKVKDNHHIILLDEFCSFELLHDLCYTSNYIVTPNKLSAISSGVLGYAAYFGKPVIGPNTGIMGRLIRKYRLGIPLISISPQLIKDAICEICSYPYKESSYRNIVDLQNFTKVIYSNLIGI